MRRELFQRCLFVLLLASRLLFGEVGYAMPHEIAAHEAAAATHEQPCPQHAADMTAVDAASHKDCCGNGDCHCPCLHLCAVVTPTLSASLVIVDQSRMPASAAGSIPERVSALFRPPA